ncbi:hypothetical protein F4802DRAFT_591607 [Xylaria palmicola]|nr:hypothetical protein F4802DRAFT_591607 [Xylaria palmicola]
MPSIIIRRACPSALASITPLHLVTITAKSWALGVQAFRLVHHEFIQCFAESHCARTILAFANGFYCCTSNIRECDYTYQ